MQEIERLHPASEIRREFERRFPTELPVDDCIDRSQVGDIRGSDFVE
jgi:hypothetical protein